jgi:hypothetical protein
LIPASASGREDVEPEINQSSSAITEPRKTRFVGSTGRIDFPSGEERVNLRGLGAKIEYVPVPVLERA